MPASGAVYRQAAASFGDLDAVINHYKPVLGFELCSAEQADLVQFLKSL